MLSDFIDDIEEYNIDPKERARGSYGFVHEAWRKTDNKHVAIKTMINRDIDLYESKRLLRELQILSTNHPKCLQLVAFSLTPVLKIITPYMSNGTLNNLLEKKHKGNPDPNFTPTKMMCSIYIDY